VIDHDKVARLKNTSVLMIGDSTTTKMFSEVCDLFGASTKSFIDTFRDQWASPLLGLDRSKYTHKLRSMDHHACQLLSDGLTLGGFAHYGATGPPYWSFAYPLAPWLAPTTRGQIRHDIPKFRTKIGRDPELIVATSGYWDISAWWKHVGNFSRQYQAGVP